MSRNKHLDIWLPGSFSLLSLLLRFFVGWRKKEKKFSFRMFTKDYLAVMALCTFSSPSGAFQRPPKKLLLQRLICLLLSFNLLPQQQQKSFFSLFAFFSFLAIPINFYYFSCLPILQSFFLNQFLLSFFLLFTIFLPSSFSPFS